MQLLYDPEIAFLNIYPREMKACSHRNPHMNAFEALFLIAKNCSEKHASFFNSPRYHFSITTTFPKLLFFKFLPFDPLYSFLPTPTPPLATTNPFSVSISLFFACFILLCVYALHSTYKRDHTVFVFLWLISLSIMPSKSTHMSIYPVS